MLALGCLGLPETLPVLFQIPSQAVVLVMWLQGSFLREQVVQTLCHRGRSRSPDRKESRAPGSMAGGWQARSQTWVSEPRRLSVPPKCDDWRLLACNAWGPSLTPEFEPGGQLFLAKRSQTGPNGWGDLNRKPAPHGKIPSLPHSSFSQRPFCFLEAVATFSLYPLGFLASCWLLCPTHSGVQS